jgi:hypothetical protein
MTREAAVCGEQGLPLSAQPTTALDRVISVSEVPADRILYVDEFSRPSEPWQVSLNTKVP